MKHRLLIIKPSSLGDVANALAVVPGVRKAWPDAEVHWLANAEYQGLVLAAGVDHALVFERGQWRAWSRIWRGVANLAGLCRALRAANYDAVLDLQGLLRSALFARVAGAPERIGFSDAREGATWMYTRTVAVNRHGTHAVDACMAVARALCGDACQPEWRWPGIEPVVRGMHEASGTVAGEYVVLVAGARHVAKRWPEQRFAEAAAELWQRHRWRMVLVGDRSEEEMCARIKHTAVGLGCDGSALLPLAGRLSLVEVAALCRDSRLVLAGDTGVMHLAVAVGARVVALMGPTRPESHGPYGQPGHVVSAQMECVPCQSTRGRCKDKGACMRTITVEAVMAKIDEVVAETT